MMDAVEAVAVHILSYVVSVDLRWSQASSRRTKASTLKKHMKIVIDAAESNVMDIEVHGVS